MIGTSSSGKTFTFGVPGLQAGLSKAKLDSKGKNKAGPVILVVAPTRELAVQTQEQLEIIGKSCGQNTLCVFGGVSKENQITALKQQRPIAVVGTPGRLLDLARDHLLDLGNVSYLVLDEADRMLDKGFEPDIRAIIAMTKSTGSGRQTCMFSATWPPAVRTLAETFMKDPVKVTVGSPDLAANRRITQSVFVLEGRDKERKLQDVLRQYYSEKGRTRQDRILVFALYKKVSRTRAYRSSPLNRLCTLLSQEAQRVENNLRRLGHTVAGIHGDLSQNDRLASLAGFKSAETPILVATGECQDA